MQRMTVISQVTGASESVVYMKGAPEMVASFCRPETVPSNFAKELDLYTFQGFRVIGLAYKEMRGGSHDDFDSMPREEVESDLLFLGILILENRLKPETNEILKELNTANIRAVMITALSMKPLTSVTAEGLSKPYGQGTFNTCPFGAIPDPFNTPILVGH